MDPITHSLAGAAIAQLGFKRKGAFWVLLISSVAPDIDYITRFWGVDVFLRYHRGITHGILALFLVPLIIAVIAGFRKGFFITISCLSWPTGYIYLWISQTSTARVLSPFDWNAYSLDISFIIDPYISIGLFLCVVLGIFARKKRRLSLPLQLFFTLIFRRQILSAQCNKGLPQGKT